MPSSGVVQISARVDPLVAEALRLAAALDGVSQAQFVEEALRAWIGTARLAHAAELFEARGTKRKVERSNR